MTTGKNIDLTRQNFGDKGMSMLLNMLSSSVITFLPRSKCLLISWLKWPSAVILEPKKIKSDTVSTVSPSICHEVMGPDAMILVFWMLLYTYSVQFSRSVMSHSVTPWTAARQASLSITNPRDYSHSCPLSQWCHQTTSSSVIPFSSCLQSFPALGDMPKNKARCERVYTVYKHKIKRKIRKHITHIFVRRNRNDRSETHENSSLQGRWECRGLR